MYNLGDKICNFVSLYRSPNQSEDDFGNVCNNSELTLDAISATNPFFIVAIGDFNANSSNWYTGDKTTSEGSKIEAITSQFGLQQIINEPTHIQGNYVVLYRSYLFLSTKFGDEFRYPLASSPKLPSSDNIC